MKILDFFRIQVGSGSTDLNSNYEKVKDDFSCWPKQC